MSFFKLLLKWLIRSFFAKSCRSMHFRTPITMIVFTFIFLYYSGLILCIITRKCYIFWINWSPNRIHNTLMNIEASCKRSFYEIVHLVIWNLRLYLDLNVVIPCVKYFEGYCAARHSLRQLTAYHELLIKMN